MILVKPAVLAPPRRPLCEPLNLARAVILVRRFEHDEEMAEATFWLVRYFIRLREYPIATRLLGLAHTLVEERPFDPAVEGMDGVGRVIRKIRSHISAADFRRCFRCGELMDQGDIDVLLCVPAYLEA